MVSYNQGNEFVLTFTKDKIADEVPKVLQFISQHKDADNIHVVVCYPEQASTSVPYSYTEGEIAQLSEINSALTRLGFEHSLSFNEGYDPENPYTENSPNWSFEIVVDVNKRIDGIVRKIKDLQLSPYQTLLYIHRLASVIPYSRGGDTLEDRELIASIVGLGKSKPSLCCAGYASFVKTIIDRLNDKNLCCEIDAYKIYNLQEESDSPNFISCHAMNIVSLHDKKYRISGIYAEDATPALFNSRIPSFAYCAVPLPDLMHRHKIMRAVITDKGNHIIHGHAPREMYKYLQDSSVPTAFRNLAIKMQLQRLPFYNQETGKFDMSYTHISMEQFVRAYDDLLVALGEKSITKQTDKIVSASVAHASIQFMHGAENCFYLQAEKNKGFIN